MFFSYKIRSGKWEETGHCTKLQRIMLLSQDDFDSCTFQTDGY